MPSFLGALAAVAATFWMVRAFAAADTAFFAALILGLSVLLISEAKIAKTDAVLLATVTAAQAVLLRVYVGSWRSRRFRRVERPQARGEFRGIRRDPHFARNGQSANLRKRGRKRQQSRLRLLLAGWAALGLGVLIKGPVIAIVCAATIAALLIADRDWRWLTAVACRVRDSAWPRNYSALGNRHRPRQPWRIL